MERLCAHGAPIPPIRSPTRGEPATRFRRGDSQNLRLTLYGPECRCLWGVTSSMPASARRKLYLPTSAAPHSTPTVRLWVRCIQVHMLRKFASAPTSAPWVWTGGLWGIWGCGGGAPEPSHSHSCWTPPVRGRAVPERWAATTQGGSRKLRPLAPTIIINTMPPFPPTTNPTTNG